MQSCYNAALNSNNYHGRLFPPKRGEVQINNLFPFLEEAKQQQQLQIIIPAEK